MGKFEVTLTQAELHASQMSLLSTVVPSLSQKPSLPRAPGGEEGPGVFQKRQLFSAADSAFLPLILCHRRATGELSWVVPGGGSVSGPRLAEVGGLREWAVQDTQPF